jgi:son of sevenless-like protein
LFNILEFESYEIAKELTRISEHIISKIEPKEFFKGVFTKKNKEVTSPNITEITNRFNKLSFWVIEEILSYDYAKDRAEVIEKFIDISKELINLNNFNDSMSVVSALGQIIVTDLVKTWKFVSKESNTVLQNLKNFLNFQDNYKNIRDSIDECLQNNEPYIPFMGPYNKRICFLEEYGPYVKDNYLINVDKIVLVQQILDQIYKCKLKNYNLVRSNKNAIDNIQNLKNFM